MTVLKKEKTAAVLKKQLPRKSNCCVELVTLKKCEEVVSTKIKLSWKSGNTCENGNCYLKKRNQFRLAIPFNFPQDIPPPWGISWILTSVAESNEKEIIRLCLCHTIFINFKVMYHKLKICLNSRSSRQSCSREKAVPKNFAISTGKRLCWSLLLIDLRASTFLKREYCKILHIAFLWILQNF